MKSIIRGVLVSLACAVLLLTPEAPASAQKVIAVQYKLFDANGRQRGDTTGVGESASVTVGETVRIELVGTAIIDGVGEEVPIDATFNVAAGRENIQLGRSGDNWVTVSVRGDEGGRAQVGFSVSGDYEMRGRDTSGRVTLEIEGGESDEEGDSASASAEQVTGALYRTILNARLSQGDMQDDIDRIDEEGYRAAVEVAAELAEEAENQGFGRSQRDRGYEAEDIRRVGTLYRGLLKRQQTDQQLWNEDRGFADNVRGLHRNGLEALVQTIVGSQEFQQAWGFSSGQSRRR
jgi:hypothetical protein